MGISKEKNRPHNRDQGFSLVEVLICLAILAIFCIPLFQGFRYSAYNNRQAHLVHGATSYAQETLETVKGMRINAENPGDVADQLVELLQDPSSASATAAPDTPIIPSVPIYQEAQYVHLFTPIIYTQERINIGGVLYDMEVVLDPSPYSTIDASTTGMVNPNNGLESAADANVMGQTRIEDVNGMDFAVITDEIHLYDDSILNTFQANALLQEDLTMSEAEIHANLIKTVNIDILPFGTDRVEVICDVNYRVDGTALRAPYNEEIYNVYRGVFDLNNGTTGWESGGNIYVTAKAYRDLAFIGSGLPQNHIVIDGHFNAADLGRPIQVYLVRSVYTIDRGTDDGLNGIQLNFNSVHVEDDDYSNVGDISFNSRFLTGSQNFDGVIDLHTNIKGQITSQVMQPAEAEQTVTVGEEVPVLRSYEVTVTLTDSNTGTIEAFVEGTKIVR